MQTLQLLVTSLVFDQEMQSSVLLSPSVEISPVNLDHCAPHSLIQLSTILQEKLLLYFTSFCTFFLDY